jgi:hypothetical protein
VEGWTFVNSRATDRLPSRHRQMSVWRFEQVQVIYGNLNHTVWQSLSDKEYVAVSMARYS